MSHENVPQPSLNPITRSFSGYTAATRPLMLVICHTRSSVAALTCAPAAPYNPEASHNLWKWAGSGTDTGTLPMYLRMWLANLWRPPVPVTGRSSLHFLSGEVAHCPLKGKFAQKLKLHISFYFSPPVLLQATVTFSNPWNYSISYLALFHSPKTCTLGFLGFFFFTNNLFWVGVNVRAAVPIQGVPCICPKTFGTGSGIETTSPVL